MANGGGGHRRAWLRAPLGRQQLTEYQLVSLLPSEVGQQVNGIRFHTGGGARTTRGDTPPLGRRTPLTARFDEARVGPTTATAYRLSKPANPRPAQHQAQQGLD
jgi:hypothetical protein